MKRFQTIVNLFIGIVLLLNAIPVSAASGKIEVVKNLFSGEKSADAWYSAVTLTVDDPSLFNEEHMVRLVCEGSQAPVFVLSSWTGGAEWAMITPCAKIDGALFYSYEDMTKGFGTDLSLLNSVSVMAQNSPITLYEIDIVTADSVNDAENSGATERRVVGYLPDWSYQAYKEMDFTTLTHINISFCNPDENGELFCYIPDAEMKAIVDKAHANGVKVLAALGGGGGCDNYPPLLENAEKMAAFNENIMEYCEKHNLDGIDLDIELGSNSTVWNNYAEWCVSLRKLCDERDYLMTTASAQWVAVRVSEETFALFDFINVMGYDNDGDKVSHSTYEFAETCLKFFHVERGIPKDKLVLGVPFYGRGYHTDGTLDWNSYVPFSELVASDPANYTADFYNGIAYNGAETMRKKCELAKGYGGIMIWEITQDAVGEHSLLKLIKEEILSESENTILGDINLDGAADTLDIILLQKYLLTLEKFTAEQFAAADLDEDGKVNAFDLAALKRMILAA